MIKSVLILDEFFAITAKIRTLFLSHIKITNYLTLKHGTFNLRQKYTKPLRRIAVWNDEHGYVVQLLTNNFKLSASTIAQLYKARWMIEIFFRNIKQLLKIKSFIGTSRNAVETQIWTALSTMLLLCWLKHIAKYKWGLANLVVSLRLNTFTKIELEKWLNEPFTPPPELAGEE